MKALVIQFRRGKRTITPRHFLIEAEGVENRKEAQKLVGKEVLWISSGKNKLEFKGKIAAAHGNNGVVRAIFERGLPGQAIGTDIKILDSATEVKSEKKVKEAKK